MSSAQPSYVRALLYGAALGVLVNVAVAAVPDAAAKVISVADVPGNEETER